MAWFKRSSRLTILAVALMLGTTLSVSAQLPPSRSSSPLGNRLENAFRVPNRGAPVNRQGGGTRGPCFANDPPLTALVPRFAGQTTAEYPTFVWYMPKMNDNYGAAPAPAMEFTLKDANDQTVYSLTKPLTKSAGNVTSTPGIMSLTVTSPYPLEAGKEYSWELRVMCDSESSDRSEDQFIEVAFKREALDPTLASRIEQATPEERLVLYAQAQDWYSMLGNLVKLWRDRPTDPNLEAAWKKVLAEVELEDVAQQPVFRGAEISVNKNP